MHRRTGRRRVGLLDCVVDFIRLATMNPTMQRGAVAVLDALGFKGIWKSRKPENIVASLKTAASYAKAEATPGPVGAGGLSVRDVESKVRVFSDTVVIAVSCSPLPEEQTSPLSPEETAVAVSVQLACSMASRFVGKASGLYPPLVYRGAVSADDFVIEEEFLLGPAVDEAASEERRAEGRSSGWRRRRNVRWRNSMRGCVALCPWS